MSQFRVTRENIKGENRTMDILNLTQVHLKGVLITACNILTIVGANAASLVVLLVKNLCCVQGNTS